MEALQAAVVEAGEKVRRLKADKADKALLGAAVDELKKLKLQLEEEQKKNFVPVVVDPAVERENKRRENFDNLLRRKFFVIPAFEIYGGVGGLYDFGPPGCALMQNMIDIWRQHFILTENMLEVSCTSMTPHVVLKTSGHVDKFTDFMVRDEKTGDCLRADKLLEDVMSEKLKDPKLTKELHTEYTHVFNHAGSYSQDQLTEALKKYDVKSPDTGNNLSEPFPFNLMFQTSIGPTGKSVGFLRPETAQGIFVNFKRLLEYNGGRMPFAAAQIGSAFRNEIAPRNGLLRVREFTLAEIEHFVNPNDKSHPKFSSVANLWVPLLPRDIQSVGGSAVSMTLGEAVEKGTINSQTMGYFLGRTYLFLTKVGVNPQKLRFRQHKATEMAHYAKDCWDAEILTTYGWVECVGHADRSCYDLEMHSKESKIDLSAQEVFEEKKIVETHRVIMDKAAIGKKYRKAGQPLLEHLAGLPKVDALKLQEDLKKGNVTINLCTGETFEVEPSWVKVQVTSEEIHTMKYVPSVIEPSFGLGRILYCVLEHCFDDTAHDDEQRTVLRLPPVVAPIKAALLSLSSQSEFDPFLHRLAASCAEANLFAKIDDTGGSIGRKYARMDEVGTPFAVVVDFQTLNDSTVSIRDRDSSQQIRVKLDECADVLSILVRGRLTWAQAYEKYPKFTKQEVEPSEVKKVSSCCSSSNNTDSAPVSAATPASSSPAPCCSSRSSPPSCCASNNFWIRVGFASAAALTAFWWLRKSH